MSDSKQKKQEPVTLEEIRDLLVANSEERRAQYEQIILRMESVLCRSKGKPAKKPVEKKTDDKMKKKKEELPTTFSNTMYWWIAMYAVGDESIKHFFDENDVKKASECIDGIKDKPDGYEKERTLGAQIWKSFSKSKKSGELKTQFENWKLEKEKKDTKNVEKEMASDNEEGEVKETVDNDGDDDDE